MFEEKKLPFKLMSPKTIVEKLDEFVIGQNEAKRILAVQTFNTMLRYIDGLNGKPSFERSNVLMYGSTGCGKSYLLEKLSEIVDIPFITVDCSQLSKTGYVGDNFSDCLKELTAMFAEKASEMLEESDDAPEENVDFFDTDSLEIDGVKYVEILCNKGSFYQRRKKLIESISKVAIINLDEFDKIRKMESGDNKRDIVGSVQQELLRPLQGCTIDGISTHNFLFVCSGAFADLEVLQDKSEHGMGFAADHKVIKGGYHKVTDNTLESYGLMPEIVGRLHVKTALDDLTEDDLYHILKHSKESVLKQFQNQFKIFGVDVDFTDDAVRMVAQEAFKMKLGARSIRTVMENILLDMSYDLPTQLPSKKQVVDRDYVQIKLENSNVG